MHTFCLVSISVLLRTATRLSVSIRSIRTMPMHMVSGEERTFCLVSTRWHLKIVTRLSHLKPDNYAAYLFRGAAYASTSQYQKAIEDCNEAIRLQPDRAETHAGVGFVYLLMGNTTRGCIDVKKGCSMGFCNAYEWAKKQGYCH